MSKKLFYTYTGKWSNNVLPTSQLDEYKDSLVFHKRTRRLIYNGDVYGSGAESNTHFVLGNTTDSNGVWTGSNENISEYYEGLTIIYVPMKYAGLSSTTLNVNGLGAKNCYINNDNITNQHYIPYVPILFTFVNNSWKHADYGAIGNIDSYSTKVFNKDNQNYSYNIVFSEKSNNDELTFAYVDAEFNYNSYTNTLHVGKIDAILNSLVATGEETHISRNNRRVLTNIGITSNKQIAYQYGNTIGASYFNGNSYLGEIFNNYDNNIAYGIYSSSFGNNTITYNESEVAFGSFNAYNDTQTFSIGVGTSESDRKNALWIDIHGSTYTNNIIPCNNLTYNIGNITNKYNTIYAKTFNGTSFTGKAAQVNVAANNDDDPKYVVGFRNNELYYENSLTFNRDGQLQSNLTGNFSSAVTNSPFIIKSTRMVQNLNVEYLNNLKANELLQTAYIVTNDDSSGASLTYYIKVGGKEIHGKQNLYNNRLSGNNTYTAWGQTFWNNGVPKSINGNILPDTTNTYTLGNSSNYWSWAYITNINTNNVSFNGTNTIGSDIKFIYWNNGVATATNKTLGSTTKPIYLNGGNFVECQSYADYEASTITSFTKSIKVLKTWEDTGIAGTNLSTGTYIIQMIVGTNIYYSGIISWYADSTSSTETDEIVLHMAGKNPSERLYLKTTMVSSGSLKLQISGEKDWSTAADIIFKFKKLI